VAFTLPQKWKHGAGLSFVATHVDSPNLRVSVPQRTRHLRLKCLDLGATCLETLEVRLPPSWRRDLRRRDMALMVRP
jgi:hypothetical protein